MSRKVSHSIVNGRVVVGTGGQGLKIDWFSTNLGNLHWLDVDESTLEAFYMLGGTNYGYCAGGYAAADTDAIDKWSLSSDANATDVGNLTRIAGASQVAGCSSSTHGYASGGLRAGVQWYDIIEKWTFASDADSTDVGNLGAGRCCTCGVSSKDYGFAAAGKESGDTRVNKIEKYAFASDGNASDVGDVTVTRESPAGCSSATHGYAAGGYNGGESNVIDKWSTVSDANATDVGDLALNVANASGSSSTTHGYTAGGNDADDNYIDFIQKFSFSSDGNASDIANLTRGKGTPTGGVSSTTHGYCHGGKVNPSAQSVLDIDKYAFASDGNATDVGDLEYDRYNSAGAQY